MSDNEDDTFMLGGNIELSGFRGLDPGSMFILRKLIGSNVRKLSSRIQNLQKVSLTMKQHGAGYQINGKVIEDGQVYTSEVSDRNLFFAVNKVMEKIDSMIR